MKSQSKHGKRADDQTTVTIPMPILLRDDLKALAKNDEDRNLAAYVRIQLKRHVEENRALLDKIKASAHPAAATLKPHGKPVASAASRPLLSGQEIEADRAVRAASRKTSRA